MKQPLLVTPDGLPVTRRRPHWGLTSRKKPLTNHHCSVVRPGRVLFEDSPLQRLCQLQHFNSSKLV